MRMGKQLLPPATPIARLGHGSRQVDGLQFRQYPARQGRVATGTAGGAKIVRVKYLDEGGLLHGIGVDDATIIFVMFTPQQFIQFPDNKVQVVASKHGGGRFFADSIHIPAAGVVSDNPLPQVVQLMPAQYARK